MAGFWTAIVFIILLPYAAQGETGRVKWVADGDTIYLQDGRIIRLQGIDAPETGGTDKPSMYHGQESKNALQVLVKDKNISFGSEAEECRKDHYGRILAYVWLPDGKMVNRLLIKQGSAYYYPHDQTGRYDQGLLSVQRTALDSAAGFWEYILHLPLAGNHYIGNKRSKRFHIKTCRFGKRIGKGNQIVFSGLKQAFYHGYAPCRRCNPWPQAK